MTEEVATKPPRAPNALDKVPMCMSTWAQAKECTGIHMIGNKHIKKNKNVQLSRQNEKVLSSKAPGSLTGKRAQQAQTSC